MESASKSQSTPIIRSCHGAFGLAKLQGRADPIATPIKEISRKLYGRSDSNSGLDRFLVVVSDQVVPARA